MPKVYVFDDESPTYYIKTEKPNGYSTDEIELTDEELQSILLAEEAMLDAQALVKAKLVEAFAEYKILEIRPVVQRALKQAASQVGISYEQGSAPGSATQLHEYCTFSVPGVEPMVFGVTLLLVDGKFNLSVDITGEDSGTIHWSLDKVVVEGFRLRQAVDKALLSLPEPKVIQGIISSKEPNAPAP